MLTTQAPKGYTIEDIIGHGTFSLVFKGKNECGKVVAIKKIQSTSSPKRILKEIHFLHILGLVKIPLSSKNIFSLMLTTANR